MTVRGTRCLEDVPVLMLERNRRQGGINVVWLTVRRVAARLALNAAPVNSRNSGRVEACAAGDACGPLIFNFTARPALPTVRRAIGGREGS